MFSEIGRWQRRSLGLTTTQVAEVLGVPVADVEQYERGKFMPSVLNAAYRITLEVTSERGGEGWTR